MEEVIKLFLENDSIFGVKTVLAGLADRVHSYTAELSAGVGVVCVILRKYVSEK